MREVGALLEAVAAGEEIVITKRGTPVARLVPPEGASEARRRAALARIEVLRAQMTGRGWSPSEILAARDDGRR